MFPDAVDVSLALFAVVITHVGACDTLHVTLIFTHARSLILDAQFVVETFHVVALSAKTLEVNHASLVQIEFIGSGADVVSPLHILVGICHNPLAALAEVNQCVANLLGRCR